MSSPTPRFRVGDRVQRAEPRSYLFPGVVIGVSRTWGTDPQFFGVRHERIARETQASLLLVRRQSAVATDAGVTRQARTSTPAAALAS